MQENKADQQSHIEEKQAESTSNENSVHASESSNYHQLEEEKSNLLDSNFENKFIGQEDKDPSNENQENPDQQNEPKLPGASEESEQTTKMEEESN